jgi:hypothetical protein
VDSVPVLAVPLNGSDPLQEPLAVQAVALVEDQVKVADWPGWIEAGAAVIVTVGAGGVPTVTKLVFEVLPLALVQVRV